MFGPREYAAAYMQGTAPTEANESTDAFAETLKRVGVESIPVSTPVSAPETTRKSYDLPGSAMATADAVEEPIDVAIDDWGWDPDKVMEMRRMYGYTWVPSAFMDPIQVAPGLVFPGLKPYDKDNPPPGAIRVPPAPVAP
ncbi:MAG: hypothetical protein ACRD44_15045 [Bryobacteraceae bacterium]